MSSIKVILPITLLLIVFLSAQLTVDAQDSLGWEYQDSIKVNLQDGYFETKYLPFDVPFYLIGSNTNIDKVELTIIAADRQACCNRQSLIRTEIQNKTEDEKAACDECYSVHEQRLDFFKTVDLVDSAEFIQWLSDKIKYHKNLIGDNVKYTKFKQAYAWNELKDIYEGQLIYTQSKDSLRMLRSDSSFYYTFGKKYGWDKSGSHSKDWKDLIKFSEDNEKLVNRDKYRNCRNCEFDNRKCNTIKPWVKSSVLQNGPNFFLSIPPLDPNKNYVFFFNVTSGIKTTEFDALKESLARNIQLQADSLIDVYIDFMKHRNDDLNKIRNSLIVEESQIELKKLAKSLTIKELHKSLHDAESISLNNVEFDEKVVDRFIDRLIQHRLYSDFVRDKYIQAAKTNIYSILNLQNSINGILKDLPKKRINFLKLDLEDKYELFNRLIIANKDVNLNYLGSQDVTIPSGLTPMNNLQTIPLRNLDKVNDFHPDSVDVYIENIDNYLSYLKHLNEYILDDLILADDKKIRLKLFESSTFLNSSVRTPYQKSVRDNKILRDLEKLSAAIEGHYLMVEANKNFYKNYQENLKMLNAASKKMIDGFISQNQDVQVMVNRQTGSVTSADFKTRTKWFVTADIGLALIPFGDDFNTSVVPYFGANFNLRPVNRQAHYGLFASGKMRRRLRYLGPVKDGKFRTEPFFKKLYKATSIVVGFTTVDINGSEGERSDLMQIGGQNLNLLTGWGIRLTDAVRFSAGVVWTNKINTTPATPTSAEITDTELKRYPYFSLSFDLDVAEALGKFGKLLKGSQ